MKISGWGKYPVVDAQVLTPRSVPEAVALFRNGAGFTGIARGLGRSYGDSSLAPSTLSTRYLDHFMDYDPATGMLRCGAGLSLAEVLRVFVPRGRFLPVTPGTKFVTVGGAIASDVHGKNHHIDGSFCNHVESLRLLLASGEVLDCSRHAHAELFRATCGGMGLTGIILDATFALRPINSAYLHETTCKAANLEEALALFAEFNDSSYSVAWIDCLSSGRKLGRSLLYLGEHADDGRFDMPHRSPLNVPLDMPDFLLNHYSMGIFASVFYNKVRSRRSEHVTHYEPFFYPLDRIHHWNRIYGKRGFTQYQFVLPREAGLEGMNTILRRIVASQGGSFLAVLKAFGKGNANPLSFPMEGYTLALDFKIYNGLFELLDTLDSIVLDYAGRVYLSKDARMSERVFKQSYGRWEEFVKIRQQYGADRVFRSLQSERLGI
jgi:decaprenylphospho-beta-D-ribofuranose 2-oxidase